MRSALDSNVLLYGFLEPNGEKGTIANELIQRAAGTGILAVQALGEFLRVVRRKRPEWLDRASRRAESFREVFGVVDTDFSLLLAAQDLASRHRLQFWDAVIVKAAVRSGATLLLSEDMQDGARLDGVLIINPFDVGNVAKINHLLPR